MSVADFDDARAPRAPFPLGEVPRAGWFCIETTFAHPSPNPEGLAQGLGFVVPPGADAADFARAHGFGQEVATAETLEGLVRCFERCDAGGRGLLITRDHASFNEAAETRATGWMKALHAEPDALWAWVEWTPWGHEMVNGGEFVHFSTEYDYRDFVLTEGGAAPTRLAGATITNDPRHAGQVPCTNTRGGFRRCHAAGSRFLQTSCPASGRQPDTYTMKINNNDPRCRCLNSGDVPRPDITAPETNSDEPKDATAAHSNEVPDEASRPSAPATNSDEPKEAMAANSDDVADEVPSSALDLEGCCQQVAELLGLADDASPEDLLAAVQSLLRSNQELNDALEEANRAANSNGRSCHSRPRFRFLTSRNSSRVALQGQVPNREVAVRVGQCVRAVNTQSKSKADFCTNAVAVRERSLGRQLSPAEYSCTWREAMRDYDAGLSR